MKCSISDRDLEINSDQPKVEVTGVCCQLIFWVIVEDNPLGSLEVLQYFKKNVFDGTDH